MAKSREEVDKQYTWSVENIYNSLELWEEDFEKISSELSLLEKYPGTLSESAARLAEYLEVSNKIDCQLYQLYTYAHLRHDEDTQVGKHLSIYGQVKDLWAKMSALTAFAEPEILTMEKSALESFLQSDELKDYKAWLEKLIKQKDHILDAAEEKLLATLGPCLSVAGESYSAFNDADLRFPEVELSNGEKLDLTHGAYYSCLINKDRKVRERAFESTFGTYAKWPSLMNTTLYGVVKNHTTMAKIRKYDSALEGALTPHEIDTQVYHSLLSAVNEHLPTHHRYLSLRKKLLGVEQLEFYDLYVSLLDTPPKQYSVDEAKSLLMEAVQPLGSDYCQVLGDGLENRWVDWFENKNKRSGAYSSGCYTSDPYILMNYDKTLNSVFTLTHEAGHSMHSYLSCKNQMYHNSHYPIFLAEVASTFNEQLLSDMLIKRASSREEKLYLLNHELEQIRTTFIRQAMFAEFELRVHELVEEGKPLTAELVNETYADILSKYFSDVVHQTEHIVAEWSRIPHFYYNFYVYQYSTGFAAAYALSKRVLEGGDAEREDYLGFLKSGCSVAPVETLKKAGADLTNQEVLSAIMKKMNTLLDDFEEIL